MVDQERIFDASRVSLLVLVSALYAAYLLGLGIFRFYFSPLAKFPGPRLAALTQWYEFYYEVVLRGKFSDHITELHKIYGETIIRSLEVLRTPLTIT